MARSHDRGRRLATRTAKIMGGTCVPFAPYVAQPDIWPIKLRSGDVLQLDCKAGEKRTPRAVLKAIAQAERYTPTAVPVAVFGDIGGEPIACLPLRDLARLLGIDTSRNPQLLLGRSA